MLRTKVNKFNWRLEVEVEGSNFGKLGRLDVGS
jgi:hypothetical protein